MPRISEFFGIAIYVYHREHLPPHFHADYAEHKAQIAIGSHAVLRGHLPGRVLGLVQEWAELHRAELERCWEQARRGEEPDKIAPLV